MLFLKEKDFILQIRTERKKKVTKKFEVTQLELAEIISNRTQLLKKIEWSLELETKYAIEYVQEALDEYKRRAEEYQKEHPMK